MPDNIAEMMARIGIAFALGLAVGLERQWRARMAGLRTNVLVSVGSALFVLFGAYAFVGRPEDPTRVAAQIVSGIGFLGAGVIWKQGGSISGLNTAATLWATAAVGTLAGGGLYLVAAGGTVAIVLANTILRPLARTLDRQPTSGSEISTTYVLQLRCSLAVEPHVRTMAVRAVSRPEFALRSVSSQELPTDTAAGAKTVAEVTVTVVATERNDKLLEEAISTLSLEPEVTAVEWQVRDAE
ncbi:MgtC/SapB family protein [Rhodococcus wratislaviensis]|uniref:MgtC family protein n=1 Tax=Rhodococcus wratislaviensis NBRC 100605 TaxID=1219028 RepID=X0PRF3_RHOWR|nr:MgtC/SapB family protein [Rhodococcus wratislaviensis]GAF45459.1 MgtC family protein [Rhodococcus wratislaviensis NBRC 100605]